MTNQEGRRLAWIELGGAPEKSTYDDAFMIFAASKGWLGTFNDKMIQYLKSLAQSRAVAPDVLPDLERAVATSLGYSSWNEVGYDLKILSGPVLGPNIIANGTFNANIVPWVQVSGTVAWNVGGWMDVNPSGGQGGNAQHPNFATIAGARYRFEFDVLATTPGGSIIYINSGAVLGEIIPAVGHYSYDVTTTAASSYIEFICSIGSTTLSIDNVSMRKYPESLGPELITNGTFAANIAGWSEVSTGSASWNPLGYLNCSSIPDLSKVRTAFTQVVGVQYQVDFDCMVFPAGAVITADIVDGTNFSTNITATGHYSAVYTASLTSGANFTFSINAPTGVTVSFDNVSVKQFYP
jgi:hypothetical protein